jgi:tetratricopeptide (TPR) repeat protein
MGSNTLISTLRARHALGATNLEAALKHIGEQARAAKEPQRFVLVSDGIATLGAREVRDCVAALGEWPAQHVLHALVIGSKQDEKMLNAIVAKTHGRVVTLTLGADMERDIPRVISELTTPLGQSFEFYDEGAAWIYPKTFRDVRPGSEMIVFSQLKPGAKSKPGVVWLNEIHSGEAEQLHSEDLKVEPAQTPEFAPLLQREANAAFLNHLEKREQEENDAGKRAGLRKQRLEVSIKNRVLCPLTSLLVLETENDYQRFGIERTALADVMAIGKNGIELRKRSGDDIPRQVVQARARRVHGVDKTPAKAETKPAEDAEGKEQFKALSMEREKLADESGKDSKESDQLAGALHPFADPAGGGGQNGQEQQNAVAGELRVNDAQDLAAEVRDFPGPAITTETRATNSAGAANAFAPAPATVPAPEAAVAPPAQTFTAPDWIKQATAIPTEAELNALHQQVAGSPRDRGLRNAYANALCKAQKWDSLQGQAFEWLPFDPENPQVYEYLGRSAAGLNDAKLALRAITSIAEVAPNRAALLARAGWVLLTAKKFEMAQQMFREALKNRQDDCNIFRGLALSFWLDGKFDKASEVYEDALKKSFDDRYGDTKRVLLEEFGYLLRAELANDPQSASVVAGIAKVHGVDLKRSDAFRATLCWETDANDVDLHVVDPKGEECFYSHKTNASGLELYSDQTQGLGPEVIRCDKALSGTYHVGVNYFASGPMGVSRGAVVIFQTLNGATPAPRIVPFCLIPEGSDMRHVAEVKF